MQVLLLSDDKQTAWDAVDCLGQDQTAQSDEAQEKRDAGCFHGNWFSSCGVDQALKRLLHMAGVGRKKVEG